MSEKTSASIIEQVAPRGCGASILRDTVNPAGPDLGKERSVLIFKYLQCSSDHDPKKYSRSNTERCKGGNSLPSGMELRWECFTLLKRCERPPQLKLAQGKSNQARNAYCFWDQDPQQAIQESPAAVDLTVTGLITQDGSVVNLPPC